VREERGEGGKGTGERSRGQQKYFFFDGRVLKWGGGEGEKEERKGRCVNILLRAEQRGW